MTPVSVLTNAAGGLPIKAFLAGLDTTLQIKSLYRIQGFEISFLEGRWSIRI